VEFSITQQTVGGFPVVAVQGEVDLSSAPELRRALTAVFDGGSSSVIVDLTGVGFLDSTGLGTLVAARASAATAGGQVAVVCDQGRLLKLFTITGLDGAFAIHASIDDAVASLTD
jgi:anti-sigma B factor antagonist